MKKYDDGKGTKLPRIEVGDFVMWNARNIHTKRSSKKSSQKLYGPFKVLERKASQVYKLEMWPQWKIHPVNHVSLLEHYRAATRPNRKQAPRDPEDTEGDSEWEVERIGKSEMISYTPKVRGRNKRMKELPLVVKWKDCVEDRNHWEPDEGMKDGQEKRERFQGESPEMPGSRDVG